MEGFNKSVVIVSGVFSCVIIRFRFIVCRLGTWKFGSTLLAWENTISSSVPNEQRSSLHRRGLDQIVPEVVHACLNSHAS